MADMKWNEFRSKHKGVPQSEISELWKEYKAGNYNVVEHVTAEDTEDGTESESEETLEEEGDEEIETEEETEVVQETASEVVEPIARFAELLNLVFNNQLIEGQERTSANTELNSLADSLRGVDYVCARTDGWKLWLGPTPAAVLVNETKNVAFACNREYWQRFYHGSSLCYVDTVQEERQVLDMKKFYERQGVFINRVPVPGYEIMLPSSRLEIVNTASLMYK